MTGKDSQRPQGPLSHLSDKPSVADTKETLNRQLEAIIASSSDGIWVCDGSGRIIRINQASERLNGISAKDVIGQHTQDLLNSQVFDQSVTTRVMQSGKQETILQYVAKTRKHILCTATPSIDEQGRISLIVVNERDITELNNLRKKFEQSQKVKEKFREELSELALMELQENSIIADSSEMRNILQLSMKLAHIGASNILLLGESGTGKTMLSKLIHKNSSRKENPFVEINCAALPENLLEAELFGYEKGAFTGADSRGKVGLFEMAQGGTLFLDEIGDMPLTLQAKLLKYLDNHELRRIGGTETIQVTCCVIAATNQDLKELVQQKRFREDLYYRLSSFILAIPPLREHSSDIPRLIRNYLKKFNTKYGRQVKIGSRAMARLLPYSFPGNIRELKNIVENGVVLSENSLADDFILVSLGEDRAAQEYAPETDGMPKSYRLEDSLREVERTLLVQAKREFITTREMARHLGISQPTVVRKLKQHNIQ